MYKKLGILHIRILFHGVEEHSQFISILKDALYFVFYWLDLSIEQKPREELVLNTFWNGKCWRNADEMKW